MAIAAGVPAHVGVATVRAGTADPAQPPGAAGLDGPQCLTLMRGHASAAPLQVIRTEAAHNLRQMRHRALSPVPPPCPEVSRARSDPADFSTGRAPACSDAGSARWCAGQRGRAGAEPQPG